MICRSTHPDQEVAEVYGIVKEEICADAYAGINFFGAHAEKYRSEAQAVLQERKVTTPGSETAAATQRRTGAARALQLRRRERKHSRSEDTRPRTGASDAG